MDGLLAAKSIINPGYLATPYLEIVIDQIQLAMNMEQTRNNISGHSWNKKDDQVGLLRPDHLILALISLTFPGIYAGILPL
jgi:hypothetical protein